jgi:hypothetical protein
VVTVGGVECCGMLGCGCGGGCLFRSLSVAEGYQSLACLLGCSRGASGVGHFLGSFAMITDTGAQAEIFLSLAISASSHAVTPTRECALSMRKAKRSAGEGLGESLADLSTLSGVSVRVDRSGRSGASAGCGKVTPSTRPFRVVARRALAALVWHLLEQ